MSATTEVPVVGPRQPCPCGSGKRYKACHGKKARDAERQYVVRPFAGLPGECDWVAMREIVSAATAPLRLASGDDRSVLVCTLLPGAFPALVRESGEILLALQTMTSTGDPAADLGHTLAAALEAEPGSTVSPEPRTSSTPRLHDLIDTDAEFQVTVHDGFDYWLDPESDAASDAKAALEEANSAVVPAARLTSVEAAYWCSLGDRDQVRWVLPYDEEPLLDGLARLHAGGDDTLGEGTRLLGTFRAAGLLVPVWDLVDGTPADAVEEPAAALGERLAAAVAEKAPLTSEQRRARAGLANRQVTIR
ncbi:DUF5926 family protein [Jiangella alba]|uniref:SEC-C motif-containing protein n=1 Tax=Jiangella alba TaxID=561176 RepID=A0A1H5PK95_9ACTN|nr:DUF5926 family protein [Jiangella alba]SEF14149.1 SEC-C motif-containing protein [Jiangella alba]